MLIINGHQVELEVKLFAKEATRVPDFCVKGETGAFSRYTKKKKRNKRHKSGDQKERIEDETVLSSLLLCHTSHFSLSTKSSFCRVLADFHFLSTPASRVELTLAL